MKKRIKALLLLLLLLIAAAAWYFYPARKKEKKINFTQQGQTEINTGDFVMHRNVPPSSSPTHSVSEGPPSRPSPRDKSRSSPENHADKNTYHTFYVDKLTSYKS